VRIESKAFLKCDSCGFIQDTGSICGDTDIEGWSRICYKFTKNPYKYASIPMISSELFDLCTKCTKKIQFIVGE